MNNIEKIDWEKRTEHLRPVRSNTPVTGIPERQNHKGGAEKVLEEIMTKNFQNLARDINVEIWEADQILKKNKQRNLCQSTS